MAGSLIIWKKARLSMNINQDFNEIIQQSHSSTFYMAHQWHMAMDEEADMIQSVFLDLSKAYDRVSISGLLSKLSLIGFDYPSLEWSLSTAQTAMCTLAEHYIYLPDPTVRNTSGHSLFSDQCFS